MKTKQEIFADIREGLDAGVITEKDIKLFFNTQTGISEKRTVEPVSKPQKLSAVDIMFYIAGIILFSAIVSIIVQSWGDSSRVVHIALSFGLGLGLWSAAYGLEKSQTTNDIRKGLINVLLLTGSLLTILGGFIITNELVIGPTGSALYVPIALTLLVLGGLHIGFDWLIKRNITMLIGILLLVSSFPMFVYAILQELIITINVWAIISIATAGLLVGATRVAAKIYPSRTKVSTAFDWFAAFVSLSSMYIASYGDYSALWLCIVVAAVFGIFYLSIVSQNKRMLGVGSIFLILTITTISFRYFSGYGISVSLIVAAIGLLGSAAAAVSINKKYFGQSDSLPQNSISEE